MKQLSITLMLFVLANQPLAAQWSQQTINTTADFRGLSAVTKDVAWVSGTKGTVGRTIDGGKTWEVIIIPGAEKLDFRDIEAFNDSTAYALSIGPGENSRIYKTTDGGKNWKLQFTNPDKDAFYDAIAFWDENHGIAMSDPVKGFYRLIITDDGGNIWKPLSNNNMPAALPNEGAFAASGTCLITQGQNDAWFVTGGAKAARVFHSKDRGQSWTATETPILAGKESAGIFSIAFKDSHIGMIVGGDYQKPNETDSTAAITTDGGKTWKLIENQLPFRSGVAWSDGRWIAIGTSGSNISTVEGATWKSPDQANYNTVSFTKSGEGWAAGPKGRIARFVK
ncbi:MAG TPA: YCF48-related protein [Gemmatales bacterium]|nr:YCF48-related protein [Gemmatales bacterium]